MLQVVIPGKEFYDEKSQEFRTTKDETLQLEHSLISISKWEAAWYKPFLEKDPKTDEEIIDYVRCMTINNNVSPEVYHNITSDIFNQISEYINASMTATWFTEAQNKKHNREVITSELVYYWMISQNIPMECQKWHFNRLLTLIRICSLKNAPPKKMSKREAMSRQRALNASRRARLNSSG